MVKEPLTKHGTYEGIREDEFELFWHDLSPKNRAMMVRLLANISEKSYRRGAQQMHHIMTARPKTLIHDDQLKLHTWRYKTLKRSIGLDGLDTTSLFRLGCETHGLLIDGKDQIHD